MHSVYAVFRFSHNASERKLKEKVKFWSLRLSLCLHRPRFHGEISALLLALVLASQWKPGFKREKWVTWDKDEATLLSPVATAWKQYTWICFFVLVICWRKANVALVLAVLNCCACLILSFFIAVRWFAFFQLVGTWSNMGDAYVRLCFRYCHFCLDPTWLGLLQRPGEITTFTFRPPILLVNQLYYYAKLVGPFSVVLYTSMAVSSRGCKPRM